MASRRLTVKPRPPAGRGGPGSRRCSVASRGAAATAGEKACPPATSSSSDAPRGARTRALGRRIGALRGRARHDPRWVVGLSRLSVDRWVRSVPAADPRAAAARSDASSSRGPPSFPPGCRWASPPLQERMPKSRESFPRRWYPALPSCKARPYTRRSGAVVEATSGVRRADAVKRGAVLLRTAEDRTERAGSCRRPADSRARCGCVGEMGGMAREWRQRGPMGSIRSGGGSGAGDEW
jgi:hypothetical protein